MQKMTVSCCLSAQESAPEGFDTGLQNLLWGVEVRFTSCESHYVYAFVTHAVGQVSQSHSLGGLESYNTGVESGFNFCSIRCVTYQATACTLLS